MRTITDGQLDVACADGRPWGCLRPDLLWMPVEGDEGSVGLGLGLFGLPARPRYGLGVKCGLWESRIVALDGAVHKRRLHTTHGESRALLCAALARDADA